MSEEGLRDSSAGSYAFNRGASRLHLHTARPGVGGHRLSGSELTKWTSSFSGVAHVKCGNVQKPLFMSLLVPGVVGGMMGAVVVTQVDGAILKPCISGYPVLMGLYILGRAIRYQRSHRQPPRHVSRLALCCWWGR
jgi:uncharacterized protein